MAEADMTCSSVKNVAYSQRRAMQEGEKRLIAGAVAKEVPDRCSLFINIGTTTEEVARALLDHEGLRVVTNNLNVAVILCGNPTFEVIVAGGSARNRDLGIMGEATIDLIRQFYLDYAVIGISGVDEKGALLDYDYREVRVSQAIIEHAKNVFLVADHTKFSRRPMVRQGHLSQIDALFTDREPPIEVVQILKAKGGKVRVA